MHFAQALPSADGVSINIFGAGSDLNGSYESTMTVCQFNTETHAWKQIQSSGNLPLARRNAAIEFTNSNLTWFFGGSSDPFTGLPSSTQLSHYWHQDTSIYDSSSQVWITGPEYHGQPRANATMTQISDTNGQLIIVGGSVISNLSAVDMVTNHPLSNMSDIVVLDPRTSIWSDVKAQGDNIPNSRKHHTTTLHPDGRTLVVIGGEFFNSTGAYLLNDVWLLDTRNMNNLTWIQPEVHGQGFFRSNHTSILIDDQIWVIAGTNQSSKAVDIQLLNLTSWTWSQSAIYISPPPVAFAQVGGLKGLIGLIVGIVVAILLVVACLVFWRYRQHKKTKSFPIQHKDSASLDSANYEYEIAQTISPAIDNHSKIFVPRTSISNMAARASSDYNPNTLHSHVSSYGNGVLQIDTNHAYMHPYNTMDRAQITSSTASYPDRHFDDNYLINENGNMYTMDQTHNGHYAYGSYWESPTAIPTHQISNTSNHTSPMTANYFLMPSSDRNDERLFFKNQNNLQQLQKPNEIDHMAGETMTDTVCSSTTDENTSSSATPIISKELPYKTMPAVFEEKK
ncbi:hypothetical protein EDC96DRAFT_531355 [Choanephora cucurbitarum]|nr:hypothetical protein EDC96DRAFT_531355 [Choanephora cucurbitarum]